MNLTSTSTIYTVGTALSRAHDNQVPVALLVEGHRMRGHVVAIDGHGVVLNSDGTDHSVVRMERVSEVEVRVMTAAPTTTTTPALSAH
jgi:sRNA-binding regulator protein Hfq